MNYGEKFISVILFALLVFWENISFDILMCIIIYNYNISNCGKSVFPECIPLVLLAELYLPTLLALPCLLSFGSR